MKTNYRRFCRWLSGLAGALLLPLGTIQAALPTATFPGLQQAMEVQAAHQAGLLARRGVVGVGIGLNAAGRPVIQILTADNKVAGLPRDLNGVAVEPLVTGRLLAQQALTPAERWPRPVPIGVSVAHPDVTAGTLGARVQKGTASRRTYFVLGNNHVLANSNLALRGDVTLQPGPLDGGVAPGDVIAQLADFQTITISSTASNTMDAAIAQVVDGSVDFRTPADGYGAPSTRTRSPMLNLSVMKYGRSTRLTTGKIIGINYTVLVEYGSFGTARFVGQMLIGGTNGPFSAGGDSGSLVVVSGGLYARRAVGLLFAGSDTVTVASPIKPILSRFGVSISGQ